MSQPGALVWRGEHLVGSRDLLKALSALGDEGEAAELVDVYAGWLESRNDPRWSGDPRGAALAGIDRLAGYAHPYTAERIRRLTGITAAELVAEQVAQASADLRSQDEADVVALVEDRAKAGAL